MHFKFASVIFLLLILTSVANAQFEQEPFGPQIGDAFGEENSGSLGQEIGRGVGATVVESTGVDKIIAQAQQIFSIVLQLALFAVIVVAIVTLVWLVILLITLNNIMHREDLTGGEKAAWVLIVLFGGFIPFSIFGLILYAIAGGSKRQKTEKKN